MKDNIGNEIRIGDRVFCYSGYYKNKIMVINEFRYYNGESLNGVVEAVCFENGRWLAAYNVVSLNALGIDEDSGKPEADRHCDALGKVLNIGDRVLFLHSKESQAEIGIIKSFSEKTCLMSINRNRFGQEEYRKKYEELILLYAAADKSPYIRK